MANRRKLNPEESVRAFMGSRLRILRDQHGWSMEALAERVHRGPDALGKMERGEQVMPQDLADGLDVLFKLTTPEIFGFGVLAPVAARESAPLEVQELASAEAASDTLRVFAPLSIPGLAQIPEYTRALVEGGPFPGEAEATAMVRQARQVAVFNREPSPPRIFLVIDERVLRLVIGGREVMRKQIEHLENLAGHPGVSLQVIRPEEEAAAQIDAPQFTLITFPRGSSAVALEGIGLIRDSATVARWSSAFDSIRTQTESAASSLRLLREIKESL